MKDFIQDKVVWSRDFAREVPAYSFDVSSGRLIFYWAIGSEAGKAKLRESPELQAKAASLGDRVSDYLVEVVDVFGQKTVAPLPLETGNGLF